MSRIPITLALLVLSSCAVAGQTAGTVAAPPAPEGQEVAVFAGGCFWCMEKPFEHYEGVISVESGYTGGPEQNPTYQDVGHHRTGHFEAIRVVYDPKLTSYENLLSSFWHNIDPTDNKGQFCDKGHQYTTAIFPQNADEKKQAESAKKKVAKQLGKPVLTEVIDADVFWLAEDYHQDYYKKNPGNYNSYRRGCGRDARLKQLWGDEAGV